MRSFEEALGWVRGVHEETKFLLKSLIVELTEKSNTHPIKINKKWDLDGMALKFRLKTKLKLWASVGHVDLEILTFSPGNLLSLLMGLAVSVRQKFKLIIQSKL